MFPQQGRKTREQLDRVETRLDEQLRVAGAHQASLASLAERLVEVERHLSKTTAVFDSRVADVAGSVDRLGSELRAAFDGVETSIKNERGMGKRLVRQMQRVISHVSRLAGTFDPSIDARFLEVAEPLVKARRTMLGYDRLFTLWQAAGNVAHLGLPAVEVGSFRGGSAALLADALRASAGTECELHVVDTFEGHVDSTFSEHDPEVQRGKFKGTSYEEVREFLRAYPGVQVHQGDAAAVVRGWPERRYALAHIDVDLYRPTLECLEYFGPRLAAGGVLVVDDYESPTCPGVSLAVHEYLSRTTGFQTWRLQAEQILLVKTGAG